MVAGAGLEAEVFVDHEVEEPAGVEVVSGIGGDDLQEPGVRAVVGQAAGVVQQLAERHRVPVLGEVRQAPTDGVVEGECPAVDEAQSHRSAVGLGHARDPHVVVDARWPAGADLGDSGPVDLPVAVPLEHRDRAGRTARRGDEILELPLQGRVPGDWSPVRSAAATGVRPLAHAVATKAATIAHRTARERVGGRGAGRAPAGLGVGSERTVEPPQVRAGTTAGFHDSASGRGPEGACGLLHPAQTRTRQACELRRFTGTDPGQTQVRPQFPSQRRSHVW